MKKAYLAIKYHDDMSNKKLIEDISNILDLPEEFKDKEVKRCARLADAETRKNQESKD